MCLATDRIKKTRGKRVSDCAGAPSDTDVEDNAYRRADDCCAVTGFAGPSLFPDIGRHLRLEDGPPACSHEFEYDVAVMPHSILEWGQGVTQVCGYGRQLVEVRNTLVPAVFGLEKFAAHEGAKDIEALIERILRVFAEIDCIEEPLPEVFKRFQGDEARRRVI